MKKFKSLLILLLLFFLLAAAASSSSSVAQPGIFKIKKIAEKNILYTPHVENKEHFFYAIFRLVSYYLQNDNNDYNVIFPLMRIESKVIRDANLYIAIAFQGKPKETKDIKITQLEGGLFASYVYKGSYINIASVIRDTFQKILKTETYLPHNNEEIRLLYLNSFEDNYPENLITEIQIRVTPL